MLRLTLEAKGSYKDIQAELTAFKSRIVQEYEQIEDIFGKW